MLETCILEAEDCENYLTNNNLSVKFDRISHNSLVLKHHMQLHKFRDPLPISLLHLFIKDNFADTFDSKEFDLIWADTEFRYLNEEWVWQKNLIVEFYWKEEHFKLEFFLNVDFEPRYEWFLLKSSDYQRTFEILDFLGELKTKNVQIKVEDDRSGRFLTRSFWWSVNEDFYREDCKKTIEGLLQIEDEYKHSSESFVDITEVNENGDLVYEGYAISTSLPFEEYKKFYLDDNIRYTKRTYDIPDNAVWLDCAYREGVYILLDLRKIVKRKG